MIFEHDLRIPHRDGLWLSGNVYRPNDWEKKPTPSIISLSPYNKEDHISKSEPWEYRLMEYQGPTTVYERFDGEIR